MDRLTVFIASVNNMRLNRIVALHFSTEYLEAGLLFRTESSHFNAVVNFSCEMKRRTSIGDGGSSKRRTRSVGVTGQPDIHAVGEFVKDVPQVMCLDSLEGLDRERPALHRQFTEQKLSSK